MGGAKRCAEEGALPVQEDHPDVYVHEGVLRCAEAIASDLERTGVLRAVLDGDAEARRRLGHTLYEQDCSGWRLVRSRGSNRHSPSLGQRAARCSSCCR